ncbi:hypothetical protein ACIHCQ_10015 [Streptomyces sp. NPDC052236]|uniref:hypothetical protein n=1 Tax=Streptomyces sp. NPDC052236 TaxID=3365686 RepID=UPI0037D7166B
MRALIRVRHRRALAAIAAAGAVVVSLAACEPAAGDALSSVAVAVTTDKTGTSTLERIGFDVRWLSCTAKAEGSAKATGTGTGTGTRSRTAGSSASPARAAATVDCQGETDSGEDITLKGKVTEERLGRCVRGELISRIAGKVVFEATVLGDCDAAPTRTPTRKPTRTPNEPPRPTVTVTVTETVTPS